MSAEGRRDVESVSVTAGGVFVARGRGGAVIDNLLMLCARRLQQLSLFAEEAV